jgi:endonuclease/exonuclease/phosphatase family metal-dependent hydrolase
VAPDLGIAALPESYRLRGEGFRPWLSSGLEILSDYPIVAHWQAAFPRTICAGIDCLANKGVMLARIAVPGAADPVEIVTTHLNARRATKTPDAHSNGSFDREMATIDRFVAAHSDPRLPLIVTGDFNVDHDAGRLARLTRSGTAWAQTRTGGGAGGVLGTLCAVKAGDPCRAVDTLRVALAPRANDWQFYSSGDRTRLMAENYAIRFGPDGEGRTLSDHQALLIGYRLSAVRAERFASR